ncbi:MAG TPA: hypothetical protein VKH46_15075 [Thermoanaerobaculia bacterium]|jgi:hypothetical protein|nr:hypothetical protein [Thermoanaerobaculia bacterium]
MKTALVLGLVGLAAAASAAPVTRAQLVAMAKEGVDPAVMKAIVERDCVDFEVDAGNAADLSRILPASVLEAAIACRRGTARTSGPEASAEPGRDGAAPAPGASAAEAELRVRATFIGESARLACECSLDGRAMATLVKEEQGRFGEAVERAKIVRESGFVAVLPGRHSVVFRCDPHGREVPFSFDVAPGERRTIEVAETALRRWKLRRTVTEKPPTR